MADIRIMTFNMLHIDDNPENDWNVRKELIASLIQREEPDVIGTQECLYSQVNDIISMHPEFDWIGMGRQGGSEDDFMAIFYRKSRFSVLAYNHFWLSDTPSEIGSMTFGNKLPRMVTWVQFFDKQTEKSFYHMNTHLDYVCEEARIKGAHLINEKVKAFQDDLPVFLTGDFNTDAGTLPYTILTNRGPFKDTWDDAEEHINPSSGTKNDFMYPDGGDERIDWILAKGVRRVKNIKIIDDVIDGMYPSDHFPVIAECRL